MPFSHRLNKDRHRSNVFVSILIRPGAAFLSLVDDIDQHATRMLRLS